MVMPGFVREMEHAMRNIPMDLLRTYATVVELGSVTRAANALGRSQPAASLQLKRLETFVGVPLCQWDGRRMALTAAGETMLRFARQILSLNDEALGTIVRPAISGHVRVGTPNDFAITFLPRILGRFATRYPSVTLEVNCDLSINLMERFSHDGSDLDLVLAMHDKRNIGKSTRAWREKLAWVASPTFSVHERRPLPLVVYPDGCVYRRRLVHALEAAKIPFRVVYCSPSLAGLQAAIMSGLGVTVLAQSTVPEGLSILDGKAGLPELPDVTIGLHCRRRRQSPAVGRLADFVAESLDESEVRRSIDPPMQIATAAESGPRVE
jgi:DNA-binding transcriptional LysR family regulator